VLGREVLGGQVVARARGLGAQSRLVNGSAAVVGYRGKRAVLSGLEARLQLGDGPGLGAGTDGNLGALAVEVILDVDLKQERLVAVPQALDAGDPRPVGGIRADLAAGLGAGVRVLAEGVFIYGMNSGY
jgi:hypothetical protein